jgi:hypothetical protein
MLRALAFLCMLLIVGTASSQPDPNQCVPNLLTITAPDAFHTLADAIKDSAEGDVDGEGLQRAASTMKAIIRWAMHWESRCAGRYMSAAAYDDIGGWAVQFNIDQYLVEAVASKDMVIELFPAEGACEYTVLDLPRRQAGQRTFGFMQFDESCTFDVFVTTDAIHWEVKFVRLTSTIPDNPNGSS